MNENLLDPSILYEAASKIEKLKIVSNIDCIYGYEIDDKILASAVSLLSKKPLITDELLKRSEMNRLKESFSILMIIFEIRVLKNIIKKIKEIRKLGFEVKRKSLIPKLTKFNQSQIKAKIEKLGHFIPYPKK